MDRDDHALTLGFDVYLGAGMEAHLLTDLLGDHDLALGTDPMSHTLSV